MKQTNLSVFPTKLVISTFLLLGAFLSIQSVQADEKQYPGSMCHPYDVGQPIPQRSWGSIYNHTNSWLGVDCPAVKDHIWDSIEDGGIRVVDRNPLRGADVKCSLLSVFYSGNRMIVHRGNANGRSGTVGNTEGSSNSVKTITHSGVTGSTNEHHFYSCNIPPIYNGKKSGIINCRIDET